MGCGWCTFVLRANNFAQPPTSLEAHLTHCPFAGGRIILSKVSEEIETFGVTFQALLDDAERCSQTFQDTFPLVRGYPAQVCPAPERLKTKTTPVKPPLKKEPAKPKVLTEKRGNQPASEPRKKAKPATTPRPKSAKPKPKPKSEGEVDKKVQFDVPLTLPPAPAESASQRKSDPACLYVCPLCGDNALASLRQRDEHLQSVHNGELVFPCQICGMAYPLYIALRRHAALKHDADYDLVRYGDPELLNNESVECPECQLVAFSDRGVLKLHLIAIHQMGADAVRALMRSISRKIAAAAAASRSSGSTGPRGGRSKREPKAPAKVRTSTGGRGSKTVALSRLERILGEVQGDHAPACCRQCRIAVDNAKEFRLHLELDHVESEEECEQLGCQACGRIFFGPGGRIDLIGHLRVLHQDADQSSALSCPHAEQKPKEVLSESGEPIRLRPCEALFSSPRLRQVHSVTARAEHLGFSCPLSLELPDCENQDALDLSEQLRAAIMETETAADREGLIILAYCCPNCSRLFAGSQAPMRFASHRLTCRVDNKPSIEDTPIPVVEHVAQANEIRPRLLESVLREDPQLPIKR